MFQRLFAGRNGPDHISLAVLILALIVDVVFMFTNVKLVGQILSLIIIAYAIFRMFSKNVTQRRTENYKFVAWWSRLIGGIKGFFARIKYRAQDAKTHKIFKCPNCKQKLRVPKGKGKITITCSKCGNKFTKKT